MPTVGLEPTISGGERPQAACLLRSWVRIPPGAWIFVRCECRVLSGRGLCDELITRPEESYRLCCVVVCDLHTSRMGAPCIYDISRLRVNPLNAELNPICHLLALLGAHHILHISGVKVKAKRVELIYLFMVYLSMLQVVDTVSTCRTVSK